MLCAEKYSEAFYLEKISSTRLFLVSFFTRLLSSSSTHPCILHPFWQNHIYRYSLFSTSPSLQISLSEVLFLQAMPLFENHLGVFHCLQKVQTLQLGIDPVVNYLSNNIFHFSFTQKFLLQPDWHNHVQKCTPLEIPLLCLFSHHSFSRAPLLICLSPFSSVLTHSTT